MYIGGGIFLLVVGAILAFAIQDKSVSGVDLEVIGWICMGGGALAIVLSFMITSMRRNNDVVDRRVVEERRDPNYPPRY